MDAALWYLLVGNPSVSHETSICLARSPSLLSEVSSLAENVSPFTHDGDIHEKKLPRPLFRQARRAWGPILDNNLTRRFASPTYATVDSAGHVTMCCPVGLDYTRSMPELFAHGFMTNRTPNFLQKKYNPLYRCPGSLLPANSVQSPLQLGTHRLQVFRRADNRVCSKRALIVYKRVGMRNMASAPRWHLPSTRV